MTAIKPEIYISWIPRGNIGVKPEIYAAVIPSDKVFAKITADTLRIVGNSEKISADTICKLGKGEKLQADSLRVIKKTEKIFGDTSRKIGITTIKGDTLRVIKNICTAKADTLLKIGVEEKTSADTSRNIKIFEKVFGDTCRQFGSLEIIFADTSRRLIEKISADTLRKIVIAEKTFADTVIRSPYVLNYFLRTPALNAKKKLFSNSSQSITNTFKDFGVTSFSVTLQEKTLSDTFQVELARPFEINEAVRGQFLDYPFNFLVEESSQKDLIQSISGMYDVDQLLYTRFYMGKAKTSLTFSRMASSYFVLIASYMGLSVNMKFQDFRTYNIEPGWNVTYASFLSSLFGWTSKLPQRQINVFIRGNVLHCVQRGCEESVFDISELPHSRPNIDKKLLRTMWNKGEYENEDDDEEDDDGEWSEEEISKPFTGTISFSDNGTSVSLKYVKGLLVSEKHKTSNSKEYSTSSTTYEYISIKPDFYSFDSNGEIIGREYYLSAKYNESYTYQYGEKDTRTVEDEKGEIIDSSTITKDKKIFTSSKTEYFYKETKTENFYLFKEREEYEKTTYQKKQKPTANGFYVKWELEDSESSRKNTYHIPIGNGWYGTSVYVNGDPQGSSVSQGKPGSKVSLYTINEVQKTFTNAKIKREDPDKDKDDKDDAEKEAEKKYKEMRQKLSPIADISFPVYSFSLLCELTLALEWLNRKVQEEVTVDVIDKIVNGIPKNNHIIDFTERIKFNGNEYYLVSNQIKFTPKKLVQSLKLVRWY